MPSPYFRLDTRKLSFRECWWQTRSPAVLVLWLLKLLRIRLSIPTVLPYLHSTRALTISPEAIPPAALAKLEPVIVELSALGFHSPAYYRYASTRSQLETFLVAMLHPMGDAVARVMQVTNRMTQPPKEFLRVFFLSQLTDGTWFVTSPQRQEFESVAGLRVFRRLNAGATELWRIHETELARQRSSHPPRPIFTLEEAEAASDEYEHLHHNFHVSRGVYQPLTAEDEAAETTEQVLATQAQTEVGAEHAEVMVEIAKLQNPKPSLKSALWLLGLSFVAFVGLGGARWEWEFVILLIPILVFHEAGHWLAMRIFGYRNLRMFFIPLFGAAVSGQNFNAAGWKKALISLAGPAPGIVLGTSLAFGALVVNQPWLERFAMLAIIINAFNLLPFVPLDGGWFLNAILFCRRAWLETSFKLFAVVSLLAASVWAQERIWGFLGILMALSLRSTWRLGRLTDRFRREGFAAQSLDRQTIPPAAAVPIIAAVKASTAQRRPLKIIATETLNVFERLNAHPPGLWASLGLLAGYGGTLLVAFAGLGAVHLARTGFFGDGLDDPRKIAEHLQPEPQWALDCHDVATWPSGGLFPPIPQRRRLTGVFSNSAAATAVWNDLTNSQPPFASRVGPVVFCLYPESSAARSPAETLLAPLGTNFFVTDSRTNLVPGFELTCQLPEDAKGTNVSMALAEYFALPELAQATPPWMNGVTLNASEQQARRTWRLLGEAAVAIERTPEMRQARKAMFRAFSRSNTNQMNEAIRQVEATRDRLLLARETDLLSANDSAMDPRVVALHRSQRDSDSNPTNFPAMARELGQLTGAIPTKGGAIEETSRELTANGEVKRQSGRLVIQNLEFAAPEQGLPALLGWLCEQGCSNFRFELRHPSADDEPQ